jgi:hypothetical protein
MKSFLLRHFTMPADPSRLTSSVVTPQGYKVSVVTLVQPTSSRMTSHRSSASFPMAERERKNRESRFEKD